MDGPQQSDEADRLVWLKETIERLSVRRFAKDIGLADEFEPDSIGCGSEAADVFLDGLEVQQHFATNMTKAFTVRWEWDLLEMRVEGPTGWFFANGQALVGHSGLEKAYPFRMSGVLSWQSGRWKWRMLHASEPVG
ncbi:MAG TPA: nuclear transport factor 2 family protein [Tianweitania sediminis]|jgi:hypothetical protein|nr:nuclear transport factor 2 family protein [Tianweitania sediminis]